MISENDMKITNNHVLLNTGSYIYILPDRLLRQYISNYTIAFPNKNPAPECFTLIPDASSTIAVSFDGNSMESKLWGTTTKTIPIGTEANHYVFLLLIEFHPGGLYHFTGIDQSELTDLRLPLALVDKRLGNMICYAAEQAQTIDELVGSLDGIFLNLIDRPEPSGELTAAIKEIIRHKGLISVEKLSGSLFYSERHMNRLCARQIGMSMKLFSRLVRVNNAIRFLQNTQNSLTYTSYQFGFYDQSHFINDFKSVCNITPKGYLKNMSDFYNENFKL